MKTIDKFIMQIKEWGGDIIYSNKDIYCDLAPFTHYNLGINYKNKILFCESLFLFKITELIHEAGHIFACREEPNNSNEWDFFGWEYLFASSLGFSLKEFCNENSDYRILWEGEISPLGNIPKRFWNKIIEEAIQESIDYGCVKNNKFISIR